MDWLSGCDLWLYVGSLWLYYGIKSISYLESRNIYLKKLTCKLDLETGLARPEMLQSKNQEASLPSFRFVNSSFQASHPRIPDDHPVLNTHFAIASCERKRDIPRWRTLEQSFSTMAWSIFVMRFETASASRGPIAKAFASEVAWPHSWDRRNIIFFNIPTTDSGYRMDLGQRENHWYSWMPTSPEFPDSKIEIQPHVVFHE